MICEGKEEEGGIGEGQESGKNRKAAQDGAVRLYMGLGHRKKSLASILLFEYRNEVRRSVYYCFTIETRY